MECRVRVQYSDFIGAFFRVKQRSLKPPVRKDFWDNLLKWLIWVCNRYSLFWTLSNIVHMSAAGSTPWAPWRGGSPTRWRPARPSPGEQPITGRGSSHVTTILRSHWCRRPSPQSMRMRKLTLPSPHNAQGQYQSTVSRNFVNSSNNLLGEFLRSF